MGNNRAYTGRIAATVGMATILFMVGMAAYIALSAQNVLHNLSGEVRLALTIKDSITVDSKLFAESIRKTEGVAKVEYVDKGEAEREFSQYLGINISEVLGENPLPCSFIVTLDPQHSSKTQITRLSSQLGAMAQVESVSYEEQIADEMYHNTIRLRNLCVSVCLILSFIGLVIIFVITRLMVGSGGEYIAAAKAKRIPYALIRKPFLVWAVVGGATAGIVAAAALWGAVRFADQSFATLRLSYDSLPLISSAMVVVGTLTCLLFTYISTIEQIKR